jgi:hypothetical protein
MEAAIAKFAESIGVPPQSISWMNQPKGALAFGIAHFVDARNQDYYLGRYYRSISPNRQENSFPNILPGGFRLQTKAAKKEQMAYKPTDVLTQLKDLTPDDIYQQIVTKFGADSDEARATEIFMSAATMPIAVPRGNMDPDAFSNYFCELLQPIALVQGKPVKGNASQAEAIFMPDTGFGSCTISFGSGKNTGLSDSTLTDPKGRQIIVSSKAKDGASAAASNLKEKVDEVRNTENGQKLLKDHAEEVAMLDMIVDGGYINGPLNLAVLYNIIDQDEANQIKALRKYSGDPIGKGILSDRLEKIYQARSSDDPSRIVPFFHLLAAVAHLVADYVNDNTGFSDAAAEILNQGALVQMYTITSVTKDQIIIKEFQTVYPSKTVTGVRLHAGKTYYSTANKGNFTFQILKNGAKPSDLEVQDAKVDTKPDVDLDQYQPARADIKASGAARRAAGDEKTLGRKRR